MVKPNLPFNKMTHAELCKFIGVAINDIDLETLVRVAQMIYDNYPYPLRRKHDESPRV